MSYLSKDVIENLGRNDFFKKFKNRKMGYECFRKRRKKKTSYRDTVGLVK